MKPSEIVILMTCWFYEVELRTDNDSPGSVINICEGQKITIKTNPGNRTIQHSRIFRDRDDKNLMVYADGEPLVAPAIEYRSPTWIVYRGATVNESGSYDMLVSFSDGTTAWSVFEVNVIAGCPVWSGFYSPVIMYRVDKGDLQTLSPDRVINIEREETVLVNVTIPPATPPVTCTITGQNSSTQIYDNSHTYCIGIVPIHGIIRDGYIVRVKLEHINMPSCFNGTIQISTTTTTKLPQERENPERPMEKVSASKHSSTDHCLSTLVIAWIILCLVIIVVAMLIVLLCKTQKHSGRQSVNESEMETLQGNESDARPSSAPIGTSSAS